MHSTIQVIYTPPGGTERDRFVRVALSTPHPTDHSFFSDHPEVWKQIEDTTKGIIHLALMTHGTKNYF